MADYSEEIKAQCLAALLTGQSPSLVAKAFGIPVGTLHSWKSRQKHGESLASLASDSRAKIGMLLLDYLETTLRTLSIQQELFGNAEWIRQQGAAELATLHGISFDKALQLLQTLDDPPDGDADAA